MASPSVSVVNEALYLMGGNTPLVTGAAPTFDNTPAGLAAQQLYVPCVQAVMRQFAFDFARNTVVLALSGNAAPFPWALEYKWPENTIEIWQVSPTAEDDPFDPLPVNYVIANAVVDGSQQRVIHTDLADAQAVLNNYPSETTWDSLFRATVVRLLASEFAIALGGKPDTSAILMQGAGTFSQLAASRQD